MRNLTPSASIAAFALLASPVFAQVPAHATHLNPNSGFHEPIWVQIEDTVMVFARDTYGHYGRSTDGGRTWSVIDQSLGQINVHDVAHAGDTVVVCGRIPGPAGTGGAGVFVSQDRGATWSPSTQVGTFQSNVFGDNMPTVAMIGSAVFVAWTEPQSGSLWLQRSLDGGATWPGPAQLVASWQPPFGAYETKLSLLVDGTTLHVFWHDGISSNGLMQTSTDLGTTWLPTPNTTPLLSGNRRFGTIGGSLLMANLSPLYASNDGGMTWAPMNGLQTKLVTDFAVDGQTLAVVGVDVNAAFQVPTWSVEVSQTAGATWPAPPLELTSAQGFWATAHVIGEDTYVNFRHSVHAWELLVHSEDYGANWRVMEPQVGGFDAGPDRNIHVRRVGTLLDDVYVYVGAGFSTVGSGTAGTGGVTPQLALDDIPLLGRALDFTVADAVGGSLGVLGMSVQAPQQIPFAGGELWLNGAIVLNTFATGGATGTAGGGTGAVPFAVPNSSSVAGLRITGQAAVLDPAATAGLALTRAIEVWLR